MLVKQYGHFPTQPYHFMSAPVTWMNQLLWILMSIWHFHYLFSFPSFDRYLIGLTFIFQVTSDIEHIFVYSFGTCTFSLVKYLFVSFDHYLIELWIGHIFIFMTNTWEDQFIKKKGLFWFIILQVSVHDQLPQCCGDIMMEVHGRVKPFPSWIRGRKQRRCSESHDPLKCVPSDLKISQWPSPKRPPPFKGKPLLHRPLGDTSAPNDSRLIVFLLLNLRSFFFFFFSFI